MKINGKERKLLKSERRHVFTSRVLRTKIATFTPDDGRMIVRDFNSCNRPMSRSEIEKIKSDVLTGRWAAENGNPICFTRQGKLADGQHRLLAFSELGMDFTTVVIYGLPNDAIRHIDQPRKRSAAVVDTLHTLAEKGLVWSSKDIRAKCQLTQKTLAIARSLLKFGGENRNPSSAAIIAGAKTHAAAVKYAQKEGGDFRPGFLAAVAQSYEANRDGTVKFVSVFQTSDRPVIVNLRNSLMRSSPGGNQGQDDFNGTKEAIEEFSR